MPASFAPHWHAVHAAPFGSDMQAPVQPEVIEHRIDAVMHPAQPDEILLPLVSTMH